MNETFKHMPGCLTSPIVMLEGLAKISDKNQAQVQRIACRILGASF